LGLWAISGVKSLGVSNYGLENGKWVSSDFFIPKVVDWVDKALGEACKFDCALLVHYHFNNELLVL